jgi:hypothetical protein
MKNKKVTNGPLSITLQVLCESNRPTHEINIEFVNLESTSDLFGRIRKLKKDLKHIRVLGVQESIIRTSMISLSFIFIIIYLYYSPFYSFKPSTNVPTRA